MSHWLACQGSRQTKAPRREGGVKPASSVSYQYQLDLKIMQSLCFSQISEPRLPYETPREYFHFSASMRLSQGISRTQREEFVNNLLSTPPGHTWMPAWRAWGLQDAPHVFQEFLKGRRRRWISGDLCSLMLSVHQLLRLLSRRNAPHFLPLLSSC